MGCLTSFLTWLGVGKRTPPDQNTTYPTPATPNGNRPLVNGSTSVSIVDAVEGGDLGKVKTCLARGADPNSIRGEETVLHVAVLKNKKDIVLELLKHGALVDATGQHKRTPLHHAAKQGYVDLALVLLDNHADVNAQAQNGVTPLHSAAGEGHVRVVELLLRHGADPMAPEKGESTPLHRAAGKGHAQVVACLLEAKSDVNARGWHQWTPLHYAAYQGSVDVVEVLLKHGANSNMTEQKGKRPLDIAKEEGKLQCAEVLQQVTVEAAAGPRGTYVSYSSDPSTPPAGLTSQWNMTAGSTTQLSLRDSTAGSTNSEVARILAKANLNQQTVRQTSFAVYDGSTTQSGVHGDGGSTIHSLPADQFNNNSSAIASLKLDDIIGEVGQWSSIEVTEWNLLQQLKEGLRFGADDRYLVQQARHAKGANVAIVLDEIEGSEYFAKFYAHTSLYRTELDFYLFWRTITDPAQRRIFQNSWPVLKQKYSKGELGTITAACIIMEKGSVTLEDRLNVWRRNKALDFNERGRNLVLIIEAVAKCLKLMHDYGWVHRDVKPSNIMYFLDSDRWKLVDFGISAKTGSQAPVMYTLKFAAPEVVQAHFDAQNHVITKPSMDMWSLGMVMLHGFAREPPFADCGEKDWLQMLLGLSKFPFEENPNWLSSLLPGFAVESVKALLKREPSERMNIDRLLDRAMFRSPEGTRTLLQNKNDLINQQFEEVKAIARMQLNYTVCNSLMVLMSMHRLKRDLQPKAKAAINSEWYHTHEATHVEQVLMRDGVDETPPHYLLNIPPPGEEWWYFIELMVYCTDTQQQNRQNLPIVPDQVQVRLGPEGYREKSGKMSRQLSLVHVETEEDVMRAVAAFPVSMEATPWLVAEENVGAVVELALQLKFQMQGSKKDDPIIRQQKLLVAPHPTNATFPIEQISQYASDLKHNMPQWMKITGNTFAFAMSVTSLLSSGTKEIAGLFG